MYLKRIETLGFKSFADKTVINYDQGVTGVVGPNGSGKSNVVDAVRWVLGEQSVKQLRGGTTMTDVIFSGSKSRKPHNYAYVTLVLDNSDRYLNLDYNDIEITRKVFRTGESEYLLNGTKCRLKDISDIIMDSGLGKESFNIISQDRVQSLLNSKPEDRRYIFEEAAGVLKYRKRKESATRKLKTTDENLNRVNDILGELENQVEPLRVQSENAKKYLETKDQLEAIEVALLAHEIYDLSEEHKKLKKNSEILEESIVNLTNEEYYKEKATGEVKEEIKKIDLQLEEYNTTFINLNDALSSAKADKKLFDERRKYSGEDNLVINNTSNLVNLEIELSDKINDSTLQLKSIETQKNKLDNDLAVMEKNRESLSEDLNLLKLDYNKNENTIVEEKLKISAFERQNASKLFSGVSAVINNPKLKGIVDIVSNLVEVDNKFIKAIDTALASSNQFIVCKSKHDAKSAIEYLNKSRRGRATFMPLDNINVKPVSEDFSNADGVYGFANTLISFDSKYQDVFASLLGNIVITENLDTANKFFESCKKYRIITLNGEVINPRGSITGGSQQKTSSVFSARYEYEQSKAVVSECENNLVNIREKEKVVNNELTTLDDSLYKLRVSVMQINESFSIKTNALAELNAEKSRVTEELSSLQSIVDNKVEEEELRIIEQIKKVQQQISDLSVVIDKAKFTKTELLVDREQLEDEYKAVTSSLRDEKKQLNTIEIQLSRIDVKLENNLLRLSEEYELTFERAFEEHELTMEVEVARAKVKSLKVKINAIGFVNVAAIEEYEVVKERFDFLTEQKTDILNAKEELLATIEELDKTMKTRFHQTFKEVSEQFSKMFSKLFGGGNASLTLTDASDLLNTGIEISAQPPGKKLQHLTLLSGGEKALSTLVLLFAILKVRPVPFCILDEVEAALDEANLARFANFLGDFSSSIQFIIITHRKVTMENADILYGVTMQESGVSKLVSVKLREATELVKEV